MINIDIRRNTSCFFLGNYIADLIFITNNVWHIIIYILLHSTILVPDHSLVMLVTVQLFQHYSHHICYLLFLIICQHNRVRPTRNCPRLVLFVCTWLDFLPLKFLPLSFQHVASSRLRFVNHLANDANF